MSRSETDLPLVLFSDDLAKLLRKSPSAVRRGMARGDYGPVARDGRRFYVLRDDLLASLRARTTDPSEPDIGPAKSRYEQLLANRPSEGRRR